MGSSGSRQTARPPAHVWVVEDDEDTRWLLTEVLHHGGFHVAAAASGAQALELLERGQRPCVILVDRRSHVIAADDALTILSGSRWSSIPIVLMTAEPARARASGARAVLRKPVDSIGLLGVIEQFCSHRREP